MRVLVTRSEPQASSTAARLRERGHEAIVLPLTEIVALPTFGIDPSGADYIAVTSANALRNVAPAVLKKVSHLTLFAVGDRTADEARKAGFVDIDSASGDIDALAPLVLQRTAAGDRILYLCGRQRRPDFEAALSDTGRKLLPVETYETRLLATGSNAVAALKRADAILVYAQSAARALNDIGVAGSSATFICISHRVAQALHVPIDNVRVACRPDEASMLAEIDRLP